jgi:hypothetical protein
VRNLFLLLSLAAMGVGAYELATEYAPDLLDDIRERVGLADTASDHRSKVEIISHGESVDLSHHVDPDGLTIIDFTAPW